MVTTKGLKALRQQRPKPTIQLDYTIGGSAQREAHDQVNDAREYRIAKSEHALNGASQAIRENYGLASQAGRAKARFNHHHNMRMKP